MAQAPRLCEEGNTGPQCTRTLSTGGHPWTWSTGHRRFMVPPWRTLTGAEPDAIQVARPVLNGAREETGEGPRLALTQLPRSRFRQQLKAGVGGLGAALFAAVVRGKADQAYVPQSPRAASPGTSPQRQPVPGSVSGKTLCGSRAGPCAARGSRARWRVRCGHPPACGAGVVASSPGSGVAVGVREPALAPPRTRVAGAASPSPGARARWVEWHRVLRQGLVGVYGPA